MFFFFPHLPTVQMVHLQQQVHLSDVQRNLLLRCSWLSMDKRLTPLQSSSIVLVVINTKEVIEKLLYLKVF